MVEAKCVKNKWDKIGARWYTVVPARGPAAPQLVAVWHSPDSVAHYHYLLQYLGSRRGSCVCYDRLLQSGLLGHRNGEGDCQAQCAQPQPGLTEVLTIYLLIIEVDCMLIASPSSRRPRRDRMNGISVHKKGADVLAMIKQQKRKRQIYILMIEVYDSP